jgi:hypothetical protein
MDLEFTCTSAQISGANRSRLIVTAEDVIKVDVLNKFSIQDILNHFSTQDLLDAMDLKAVKDHTGLVEPTDEM